MPPSAYPPGRVVRCPAKPASTRTGRRYWPCHRRASRAISGDPTRDRSRTSRSGLQPVTIRSPDAGFLHPLDDDRRRKPQRHGRTRSNGPRAGATPRCAPARPRALAGQRPRPLARLLHVGARPGGSERRRPERRPPCAGRARAARGARGAGRHDADRHQQPARIVSLRHSPPGSRGARPLPGAPRGTGTTSARPTTS